MIGCWAAPAKTFSTAGPATTVSSGGDGSDTLDGGPGADTLVGGLGNDIYVVDDAGDMVTEAANEGSDTVKSSISYTLGEHVENLTLTGSAAINGAGNALNNVLLGNGGANVLAGGAGNDTLKGGRGDDTYVFGRGDGRDKIVENDATAGNTDTLRFGAGITPLDLILERHVNDLRMALYGTADQITIQNWYTGAAAQTEVIQAGTGEQLLNTQVEQLIQAMAGFSAQTGLTWGTGHRATAGRRASHPGRQLAVGTGARRGDALPADLWKRHPRLCRRRSTVLF
ncbi:MAG: hypothetical protein KatS3mg082_2828 [Nitrospiraceae bacterium]|nr:MAG: hypothetical protein KatS3mg082_2828 [Nitrospiraceae bacterium]